MTLAESSRPVAGGNLSTVSVNIKLLWLVFIGWPMQWDLSHWPTLFVSVTPPL